MFCSGIPSSANCSKGQSGNYIVVQEHCRCGSYAFEDLWKGELIILLQHLQLFGVLFLCWNPSRRLRFECEALNSV